MPTKKDLQLIELAEKGANDAHLLLFDKLSELEDELNKSIKEIKDKFDNAVKEIKENTPDLNKVLESVKGKDGESPTDEYLLSLIKSLIPQVKDGHTPTAEELLKLIRPLIPIVKNGDDGKTPTEKELIDLIKPLIPIVKNGSPDKPTEVRDKLETLKGKERLDISAINGLEEKIKAIPERPTTSIFGGRKIMVAKFSFVGDGATTAFTLPHEPMGKGLTLWAHYQGQWLQPGVHFNIAKLTFTTTFVAENSATIEGFLMF